MRFLDLDLDFFLNKKVYCGANDANRLSSDYKPWTHSRARHFLENKCGLSTATPVDGRIIETHEMVIDFWRALIESGSLNVPFDIVHVDAHPDLSVQGGLHLSSGLLKMDSDARFDMLKTGQVHSGNYLTFAIAYGWIASLVWVCLGDTFKILPEQCEEMPSSLFGVPFEVVSWRKYKTTDAFDYMALSRSPNFTPLESDSLISLIKEYVRQI